MRISTIAFWRPDRFGYRLANISDLKFALQKAKNAIGRYQAADASHSAHFNRLVEQPPGRTILSRP